MQSISEDDIEGCPLALFAKNREQNLLGRQTKPPKANENHDIRAYDAEFNSCFSKRVS